MEQGRDADATGREGRKWRKLDKAIYAVGEMRVIYFRVMVNGRRETMRSPIQGAAAVGANGRPTAELRKACLNWRYKLMNRDYYEEKERKVKVPTFGKLLELYEDAAAAEQVKSGSPGARAIETAKKYFRYLVEGCGFDWSEPMTKMTTADIDRFIVKTIKSGKTPTTAWTYASSAQSVTPRWAIERYAKDGYEVKRFQMPVFKNRKPQRYERPSAETLAAVEEWHRGLWKDEGMTQQESRVWFMSTMMLRFAVRNGDVGRLTLENFKEHDGVRYLAYTPNKTRGSSGTTVNWPVHPDLWRRIEKAAETLGLEEDVRFVRSPIQTALALNRMLRQIPGLADREKASYELRKMCVDHAYHEWGVEMAAAISGDDIKTLTYFYADTSHVKVSNALLACQI